MRQETKEWGRRLIKPLIRLLAYLKISPTAVTLSAVPLSILAAVLFAKGWFIWAGITVFFVGLCDTIDGELSRLSGKVSAAGAFLDSTVDRLSEGTILIGVGWYYFLNNRWAVLLTFVTLLFSFLVSYVRARAEGVGKNCQVGFFERPVRVSLLIFSALILGKRYLPFGIGLMALGTFLTFVRRIIYVLKQNQQ